ncbi:hypothetical protein BGS_1148 [Beggiatoa sp. SS]|nr:hypothetical protein BGS_1148 [Beggiatoa sp. SS]
MLVLGNTKSATLAIHESLTDSTQFANSSMSFFLSYSFPRTLLHVFPQFVPRGPNQSLLPQRPRCCLPQLIRPASTFLHSSDPFGFFFIPLNQYNGLAKTHCVPYQSRFFYMANRILTCLHISLALSDSPPVGLSHNPHTPPLPPRVK